MIEVFDRRRRVPALVWLVLGLAMIGAALIGRYDAALAGAVGGGVLWWRLRDAGADH